jgi:hypothetical protein
MLHYVQKLQENAEKSAIKKKGGGSKPLYAKAALSALEAAREGVAHGATGAAAKDPSSDVPPPLPPFFYFNSASPLGARSEHRRWPQPLRCGSFRPALIFFLTFESSFPTGRWDFAASTTSAPTDF